MSIAINEIITVTGNKRLDFQPKYPIDENTTVELSGQFRSTGTESSMIYFGLHSFGENGEEILSESINRVKEPLLIISKNTDMKSFILEKKPETWYNSINDQSYLKIIGIYFDGNIDRLPDYLINYPAYDTYADNNIILNKELPKEIYDKIVPFRTRAMNHFSSNAYDYSAACYAKVDRQWTKFEAIYNGYSIGYGDIKGKFRLGTKSISPFVLANYGQKDEAILEIKNIEITVKNKPKLV